MGAGQPTIANFPTASQKGMRVVQSRWECRQIPASACCPLSLILVNGTSTPLPAPHTKKRERKKQQQAQVIFPTACGALFSARTTSQPSQNLVKAWWNPRGTVPQGRPGPPRSLSGLRPQGFQLLGEKTKGRRDPQKQWFEFA